MPTSPTSRRWSPISTTIGRTWWRSAASRATRAGAIRRRRRSAAGRTGARPRAGPPRIWRRCAPRSSTAGRRRIAILNCLYGVQLIMDEHMAAAFARAVNDWLVREWLDPEPRLRASIVVPPQNPARGREEIERRAADPRFVQVLLLATGEMPLGRSALLADLRSRRAARPAGRDPCRQQLSPPGHARSAGRPTTSRTMWRRPRAFRRSSRA